MCGRSRGSGPRDGPRVWFRCIRSLSGPKRSRLEFQWSECGLDNKKKQRRTLTVSPRLGKITQMSVMGATCSVTLLPHSCDTVVNSSAPSASPATMKCSNRRRSSSPPASPILHCKPRGRSGRIEDGAARDFAGSGGSVDFAHVRNTPRNRTHTSPTPARTRCPESGTAGRKNSVRSGAEIGHREKLLQKKHGTQAAPETKNYYF